MEEKQKKKLRKCLLITYITLISCAIAGLIGNNFSVYTIKLEISWIVPVGVTLGLVCYYVVNQKVNLFGYSFLRLKIGIIGSIFCIALFILLGSILGINPISILNK